MTINKIRIKNFRTIDEIDLSLGSENRVICFVGENGSAKTSVLSLIAEGIISNSRMKFPNYQRRDNLRYRAVSNAEIKSNEEFYSVQLNYSNLLGDEYIYKKLVVKNKSINPSVYDNIISGIVVKNKYWTESLSFRGGDIEKDYLYNNIFMIRPGGRYELYEYDFNNVKDHPFVLKGKEPTYGEVPYSFCVEHTGSDLQDILLNMIFDSMVGYEDSENAVESVSQILEKITESKFGDSKIIQSPYRRVLFEHKGIIDSFSQGELDILVTISSILTRQIFFSKRFSSKIKEEKGIQSFFDIPGVIIIDEIDLHLHPRAQENYLKILSEIFPRIQFIVTTHSPFVIRGLPESSVVVKLPSGRVFDNDFESMDIDSITKIIFGYEGGFSESVKNEIEKFKLELSNDVNDKKILKNIYKKFKNTYSAKNELDLLLASFADEHLINFIKGE
ncbi:MULTISPECIES: AAA family ATPase [Kosakonia]|uniref:AAA family ATPase n=1 Tax=Kosakonia TaxID=1330547 RepID=UPI0005EE6328|nr:MULTISPECIES: AAA family ATPase [Kosakonia]QHM92814.1 hypothetical protein FGE25_00410 [Kosakonia sacchari]RCW98382.1 putative ATP-binding protein involved in virulence [Kosakonia sp. AG348]